jgi:hypothetical protein
MKRFFCFIVFFTLWCGKAWCQADTVQVPVADTLQLPAANPDSLLLAKTQALLAADSLAWLQVNDSLWLVKRGDTVWVVNPMRPVILTPVPSADTLLVTDTALVLAEATEVAAPAKPRPVWSKRGTINFNFSNVGLENWAGGGEDAISVGSIINAIAKRETQRSSWETSLRLAFGITRQGGRSFEKSDDVIRLISVYNSKIDDHWGFAGRFNFDTQFARGFSFDRVTRERIRVISGFMAPGRFELASGIQYTQNTPERKVTYSATLSPATGKLTMVLSDTVRGADFGLASGERVLSEVGAQFASNFRIRVMENITFQSELRLFAAYDNIRYIDVNWDTLLVLKVNRYLNANFSTSLIYDDDIIITQRNDAGEITSQGPRVQFKHVLNIGLSFVFQ